MTVAGIGAQFLGGSSPASAVTVSCAHPGGDTVKDWVGPAGGAFNVAANWSPSGVPGATNVVCSNVGSSITISTSPTVAGANLKGSVTLTGTAILSMVPNASAVPSTIGQSSLINNLTLNSGTTLGGTMAVDLTGANSLAGNIYGTGIKTVASGATASLTPGFSIGRSDTLNTPGVLKNAGTMTWSGAHYLQMTGGGSILQNLSGGVFNMQPDDGYTIQDYGGIGAVKPKVINDAGGTIDRNGAVGTTTSISSFFDNNGLVKASSGQLVINSTNSASQSDSGTYNADGTNGVTFNNTRTFASGAAITGTSGVAINANLNFVTSGSNAVSTLHHNGGTITGNYTVSGTLDQTGGIDGGSGTTTISSGAVANMSGYWQFDGTRQVKNSGTINLTSSGNFIYVCDSALLDNLSGGVINLSAADGYGVYPGCGTGNGTMINRSGATINKTAAVTNYLYVPFDNLGAVNITAGTLDIANGNTTGQSDTGTYTATGSGVLRFSNGTRTLTTSATVPGNGLTISGGTFNLPVSPATAFTTLHHSGGTITGSYTISTLLDQTGGADGGSGTTTISSGATATVSGGWEIDGSHQVKNSGTINHTSSSTYLLVCDSGVLDNLSGGVLNLSATDGYGLYNGCGSGNGSVINRSGATINKTTAVTNYIYIPFDNLGTVNVNGGILDVVSGNNTGAKDTGTWTTASGTTLRFSGGTRTEDAATFTGAGTVSLTGATFDFGTTGTTTVPRLVISGGTQAGNVTTSTSFSWTGGTMNGAGTTTIATGVSFTLFNGAQVTDTHVLANKGTLTIATSSGALYLCEGATLDNLSGGLITLSLTGASGGYGIADCGAASHRLVNEVGGVINRTTAADIAYIDVPFDNFGTVNVNSGTLAVQGNTTADTGTWNISTGPAVLQMRGGTRTENAATFTGAGTLSLTGSNVDFGTTNVNVPRLNQSTGTLFGNVTITTSYVWSGGVQSGTGTTTIPAGVTLTLPAGAQLDNGHHILNQGTTTWGPTGHFSICNDALFENASGGTFNLNDTGGYQITSCGAPDGGLLNDAGGVFNKTAGAVTSVITVPMDNNGTVNVTVGDLNVQSGSRTGSTGDSGTWNPSTGHPVTFASGTRKFNGGTIGGGTGTPVLSGATLTGTPNIAKLSWTGGTFDYPGVATVTGTLTIPGGVSLSGKLLNNGSTTWGPTNYFYVCGTGMIENGSTGTFTITDTGGYSIYHCGSPDSKFVNDAGGVVVKTSLNTTYIDLPFDNQGTVNANNGNLTISGGSSTGGADTGTYNVASGKTLAFSAGTRTGNGSITNGPGTTLWSGTLFKGNPTFNGIVTWTAGGPTTDAGTTIIGATGTLNWSSAAFEGGHILNQGTTNWPLNTSITMGTGATFQNAGLFDIKTGNGYSFSESGIPGPSPLFTNQATGTFRLNTAAITAYVSVPFHNDGNIAVTNGVALQFNGAAGVFDNFNAGTNTLTGGTYTLSKPFQFTSANVVNNAATIVLNSGGAIQNTSAADALTSILASNTAAGTLTLNRTQVVAAFSNAGAINVNVGTLQAPSFTQSGGNTLVASGAILKSTGGSVAINGGILRGAGTVNGTTTATVSGNGTVSPGVATGAAGKLSVTGAYTPGATGTLAVDINGATTAGTDYDWLAMSTSATLNGTLAITTGAFTPTLGQTFTILTTGTTRSGTFANVTGDDLPGGLYYDVTYNATSVVLTVKAVPTITIGDITAAEGGASPASFVFNASLSAPSGRTVTVPFATNAGSATAGTDYVTKSGTFTFTPGSTTAQDFVTVNNDLLDEDDETFTVDLGTGFHGTVTDAQALATIQDDVNDLPPTMSIDDQAVTEGDAGTTDAVFNVTLSGASGKTITIPFSTTTGTAGAADFVAQSGSLTFNPGDVAKTITVAVNGDLLNETNEGYTVDLGSPTNATLADGSGAGTINDNDPIPTVSVMDASLTEPNAGTTPQLFHVSLSAVSGRDVTVPYSTTPGSALAGSDYVTGTGSITILAGASGGDISIDVVGDTVQELTETYTVTLGSPTNATVADGSATGTILDDDVDFGPASRTFPGFVVDDVRVAEGQPVRFVIRRIGNVSQTASVKYATANGTATDGSDYTGAPLTLMSFAIGETSKVVPDIVTVDDAVGELNETILLNLSVPTNGVIVDAVGTATLNDNESTPPTFIVGDVNVNEGSVATFTVTRLGDTSALATVKYATANNTAVAPTDYTAVALNTLTFNPGVTTQTVNVTTIANGADVATNKTFWLNLSAATNAGIADSQATGTIVDDEGTVVPGPTTFVAISDVRQAEGGTAIVTITRRGDVSGSTTVTVNTGPGTATGGAGTTGDFTSIPGQNVTFSATETTKSVSINTTNDNVVLPAVAEQNETFTLNASSATGGAVREDSVGTITINDNDEGTNGDKVSAFAIDDVRVVEGQTATFTVTRTGDVSQSAIIRYQTAFNTATSGTDFTPVALTNLNFAAGDTSKTITVATLPDAISEVNETFYVNLSLPTNSGVADAAALGTITDKGNNPPAFSVGDVNVNEGSTATFTITRTGDTTETASVYYYTSASTATSPADFGAVGLTLATFGAGQTTYTFNVSTVNNGVDVATNKVFLVNLTGWKNAGIADAQARGTIVDDEGAPVAAPATFLSVSDVRVVEGAGATVTISRRGDTSGTTTVKINTGPVTAVGFLNEDFTPISIPQTITFNAGELTKTVTITTSNDAIAEQHEVFTANLSANSAGSFMEDTVGQITIDDND